MANKKLILKQDLNPKIISGLTKIAAMVKRTLGPGGLPIIIERVGQALDGEPLGPKITKDGVSVANECGSSDKEEDLIIQAVKYICKKTNSVAGDGTTTAIVLGEAIVKEMFSALEADQSLNPQLVKESVESTAKLVLEELKRLAMPISGYDTIKQVATISANGDDSIGTILSEAFRQVGAEGVITIDEGQTSTVTLDVVEGYQINRGAEARDRFFNNKDMTMFEAEDAALVIYDGKLLNFTEVIPAINAIYGITDESGRPTKKVRPIVFIANEFSNEVLQFLLIQKAEAKLNFCCVKGPHTTHVRAGYYDDIATMSGGSVIGNGNKSLSAFEEEDAGLVKRVIIDKYKCTFYEGQGLEEDILKKVDQLKVAKTKAESPYDAQVINDRIAALTGGVAKIGVGGLTEFEIKEKYDRMEDALNAARAAIQEGIVPGGGVTLYRISEMLKPEASIGNRILRKALKAPLNQILENIGLSLTEEIEKAVLANLDTTYDARDKKIVNAFQAGIVDPVKVTRTALENAISIAALLGTTGGGIVYVKE